MAGLLDFVAGFGVGALGGLAEQKKANLEQKRQLNLAKLKAEYAADIETAKQEREIERRKQILALPEGERPEAAFVAGISLPETAKPTADEQNITAMLEAQGLPQGTPEFDAAFAQAMRTKYTSGTSLKGDLVRVYGGGITPFVTLSDDPRIAELGTQNPNIRVDLMAPESTTDDFGRTIVNRGGIPYVVMPDRTEVPVSQLEGGTETATQPTPTQTTAPTQAQTSGVANPAQLPPGDYVRLATGPLQAMQRFGLNLPVLGDVFGMFAANSREAIGAAQTRAAKSFEMAQRNMAIAYRYNASRTSNLDIKSAEKLFPKFGLVSTDIGTYNQAIEVRNSIAKDIEANRQIARVDLPADQLATEEARNEARNFLSNIQLVLPAIDSYINGYELTEIKIPIGDKKRQLIDLPYETLIDQEQVPASAFANLSDREKELVRIWFNYNGWQF